MADDEAAATTSSRLVADAARWRRLDALIRHADDSSSLDVGGLGGGLNVDVQMVYARRSERRIRVVLSFTGPRDAEVDLGVVMDAIEWPVDGLHELDEGGLP
jgi:hypothetical protein